MWAFQWFFLLGAGLATAQNNYITALDFQVEKESEVVVNYDLMATEADNYYVVSVIFKNENGVFTPKNMLGDVGKIENGGKNKRIVWPAHETLNRWNGNLTVELTAKLMGKKAPVKPSDGMIFVEGGQFLMGDGLGDGGDEEKPTHAVTLRNFLLDAHEVTFQQFDEFCKATGRPLKSDNGWGRGQQPAINLNWYEAIEFCNWRSEKEGLKNFYHLEKSKKDPSNHNPSDKLAYAISIFPSASGYRLPTEAEWEYAAREKGSKKRFGNGKMRADPVQMNFDPAYPNNYSITGKNRQKPLAVRSFSANTLGFYDLTGNVWEWCFDWYDASFYSFCVENPELNAQPTGASTGTARVIRGGAWNSTAGACRVTSRQPLKPDVFSTEVGFRCAKNAD